MLAFAFLFAAAARAETVSIVIASNAAPRVQFGAEKLVAALKAVKLDAAIVRSDTAPSPKIWINPSHNLPIAHEGFELGSVGGPGSLVERVKERKPPLQTSTNRSYGVGFGSHSRDGDLFIASSDDSGALYGCLELAQRIRAAGKLPHRPSFEDEPTMTLRGACVAMQKTYILPGRKVYEYPYTPDLFPWFYDKAMWTDYLDSLVANRMNTLYLWNGHPFASLVKLKDYPEAVEVSPEVFAQNVEMFHWLTAECDKRGIWLVQMFYNIFLPKPLAEKNHVSTQLSAPTPLASDYTRKSIAEFVKQYPNVGLLVCLGEALQGTENQINWATNTILPGVLDGMKEAGLKEQPPVVIRTHAMNPEAIMPACFQVYSNLFTMTKYNGESLTTYEPRGKVQQTHLNMAKLGPHIVNVHILSNLEPFRYGATEFIRKSVLASRDNYGASGIHLYPLAYWNWPYSPDIVGGGDAPVAEGGDDASSPVRVGKTNSAVRSSRDEGVAVTNRAEASQLLQWDRDWIWFKAWARYAWNPDVPVDEDRVFWVDQLADYYGCDTNSAGKILDAYNAAGEVAPMLLRRFGITDGNRQTLSLGMTLDQLVNPKKYGAVPDLWESMAPPGERLDEYVRREWNKEPHIGETPESVCRKVWDQSFAAVEKIDVAASLVKTNKVEFARLQRDVYSIRLMASNYASKVKAAMYVLRYGYSHDISDMDKASRWLGESLESMRLLATITQTNYHFANSMQTGHRKIPFGGAANGVGTNYLWSQVLPLYEKELTDFKQQVAGLKNAKHADSEIGATVAAWPAAKFRLLSTNAETYEVKVGARPFADRKYTISALAPELSGLTGIRFSHEAAKNGRYEPVEFEASEPVRVLVGYFQNERELWLQVPNLDVASQADERGGVDVLLRNAAVIDECPNLNVHAFRYEPGRYKLEMIGKGSFVILGVVPQPVELKKRDAKLGTK